MLFFEMLDAAVGIFQTNDLAFPDKIEKAQLRDFAHFSERAELANLTQKLAAYACNLKAFDR